MDEDVDLISDSWNLKCDNCKDIKLYYTNNRRLSNLASGLIQITYLSKYDSNLSYQLGYLAFKNWIETYFLRQGLQLNLSLDILEEFEEPKYQENDEIILNLNRSYPEDFIGYAEDFVQQMKVNIEQKIYDIKEELKKL